MHLIRAALIVCLLPGAAYADSAEMTQCRLIKDSAQRLTCYDAIDVAPAATATATSKPSMFGLAPIARDAEADFVETTLTTQLDGWRANQVFELTNGQRWQVTDGSSSVMRPKKPNVKIRRGAFGAFYIEFDGINQSPRVKRID